MPTIAPARTTGSTSAYAAWRAKWLGSGTGAAAPAPPETMPGIVPDGLVTCPNPDLAAAPTGRIEPLGR